jgi:acyl carrier protein/short-subunit dehydrogenase
VLITGGTGTLGGLVAGHLAAAGRARNVTLASRSGPGAPGVAALAASVAAAGAGVQVTACDAADRVALGGLLARVPDLTTVVHTAGVLDDGVIGSLTPERVDAVMRPKADAAWNLHQLTAGLDLDAFVLFSSAAGVFGGAGQGNYAAANVFLDALAAHRRAAGLPATSVAWGMWAAASGMTAHLSEEERSRVNRDGMTALTEADGLALLDAAAARDDALLVASRLDLAGLRGRVASGAEVPPLWLALAGDRARPAAAAADHGTESLRDRLAMMPAPERDGMLLDLVRGRAAAVLGHGSAEAIEPGRPFTELGFDSLTAIELRNQLHAAVGLRLSATSVFDYPTPAVLAAHLGRELGDNGAAVSKAAMADVSRLERLVQTMAADDTVRANLTLRVKGLLAALQGGSDAAPEDTAGDDLAAATAENIFDLIDQEFGEA